MKTPEIIPQHSYEIVDNINYDSAAKNVDYQVTFRITEFCNIHCDYCHWNDGKHYNIEDIKKGLDKLDEFFLIQKFNKVLFYFHGGEPMTHPDIIEIIKYIKNMETETIIEMQTNLTCKQDILSLMLNDVDMLSISYHYIELMKTNHHSKFIDNYDFIKNKKHTINNFDIMLENIPGDELDHFYKVVEGFLKYDNILNSEMIYGFCHYKYNEETSKKHLAFYKKHNQTEQEYIIDGSKYTTNDLFKKGLDCRGWKCQAGNYSIVVNGDGNIFNCGIHMTNYLRGCDNKIFGNLLDDNILIKLKMLCKIGTLCRWNYCGGDFYLKKEKR